MTSTRCGGWTAALAVVLAASPLPGHAQGLQIAPYGGAIHFSEMGEVEAAFFPSGSEPGDPPARVTNLELLTESAPLFGVSLGWSAGRALDVRLNGAFTATEFDLAGVSAAPGQPLSDFQTVGGLGDVYLTLVGADLLWRLAPRGRALSPYVVAGAGAAVWDLNALNDFQTVELLTGVGFTLIPRTDLEWMASVGLGADLRLGGRASLRFEVTDHIVTNPVGHDFEAGPDFTGTSDGEDLVNAVRLSAGVAVDLGGRPERGRRPWWRPRRR